MNFVFWQDRTVEVSLAQNLKTRDYHTQRAIADIEFPTLWHEISEADLVRIAGNISSRRENYTSGIHCLIFDSSSRGRV